MNVRDLKRGEEEQLFKLFRSTIRNINSRDYSEAQIQAWASDEISSGIWAEKIQSIKPFLVESAGQIVGYSDLQPTGLIDHFFVHFRWQGQGVGKLLMAEIERRRIEMGIPHLEAHVSVTARPFFEAFGFDVVQEQAVDVRGQTLKNYIMKR